MELREKDFVKVRIQIRFVYENISIYNILFYKKC